MYDVNIDNYAVWASDHGSRVLSECGAETGLDKNTKLGVSERKWYK